MKHANWKPYGKGVLRRNPWRGTDYAASYAEILHCITDGKELVYQINCVHWEKRTRWSVTYWRSLTIAAAKRKAMQYLHQLKQAAVSRM